MAALSNTDVWVVGFYNDDVTSAFQTLAMHWDGSTWTVTSTPNPASGAGNHLKKVVAVSPNQLWAVGGHSRSFVLRWDGTAWGQVPLPPINNRGFTDVNNDLQDIAVVAGNDIWMVGSVDALNGGSWTLTVHWDGTQWRQIPSPNVADGLYSQALESVVALASDNVWAVGYYRVGNVHHTLIEHWDGTQWSIVPSPDSPSGSGSLLSIAAAGANDMMAVGFYDNPNVYGKPLALRWDGTAWSYTPVPNPSPFNVSPLQSVTARGPNDYYAGGMWETSTQGLDTFAVRWDGAAWTQVPSENMSGDGTGGNQLNDLTRDSSGNVWAAGKRQATFNGANLTLVERTNFPAIPLSSTGVVSRQVHGKAGTFDIDLPADGLPGIENRQPANGEYVLVYSFSADLTAVDGAKVASGVGTVASREIGPNPNQCTVHLAGVSGLQHLVVQLEGVHGAGETVLAAAPARMDVVVGDANASRSVNSTDIGLVRAQSGVPVTGANFRADVTVNGSINSTDVAATKARSGGGL